MTEYSTDWHVDSSINVHIVPRLGSRKLNSVHADRAQLLDESEARFTRDFTTITRVVLVVTFTVGITSAGITAASVLDRRRTYGLLHLAGTPLRVRDAARNRETLIPVTVLGGGAVAAGLLCGGSAMLAGGDSSFDARGLIVLAACCAAGFVGILASGGLSRPLLQTATRQVGARGE
ncbi:hypothetical protein OG873_04015 [Streptomyces violaceus]|uniref:hypothetical protein n=1 Tax=Streptomyces violaceus TaxID=1936 RepID=UPI002E2DD496|nr:hypothetical protein [Streptomyces violaceus]